MFKFESIKCFSRSEILLQLLVIHNLVHQLYLLFLPFSHICKPLFYRFLSVWTIGLFLLRNPIENYFQFWILQVLHFCFRYQVRLNYSWISDDIQERLKLVGFVTLRLLFLNFWLDISTTRDDLLLFLRSVNILLTKVQSSQLQVEFIGHDDSTTKPVFRCQLFKNSLKIIR